MNGCQESLMSEDVPSVSPIISTVKESRRIPLTQGKIAIVDAEDYEWLMRYRWCAQKSYNSPDNYYATRGVMINGKHKMIIMHREILGLSFGDGVLVDHKNRNGLDNCRGNLRIATTLINARNCNIRKDNTSGYRGVYWCKIYQKWKTQINVNGKRVSCGYHKDIISAATAYDHAVIKYWGDEFPINFSDEGERND